MVRAAGGALCAERRLRAGESDLSDLSDLSDGAHGLLQTMSCLPSIARSAAEGAVSDLSDLSDPSDCLAPSIGFAQCAPPAHGTCRQCP